MTYIELLQSLRQSNLPAVLNGDLSVKLELSPERLLVVANTIDCTLMPEFRGCYFAAQEDDQFLMGGIGNTKPPLITERDLFLNSPMAWLLDSLTMGRECILWPCFEIAQPIITADGQPVTTDKMSCDYMNIAMDMLENSLIDGPATLDLQKVSHRCALSLFAASSAVGNRDYYVANDDYSYVAQIHHHQSIFITTSSDVMCSRLTASCRDSRYGFHEMSNYVCESDGDLFDGNE